MPGEQPTPPEAKKAATAVAEKPRGADLSDIKGPFDIAKPPRGILKTPDISGRDGGSTVDARRRESAVQAIVENDQHSEAEQPGGEQNVAEDTKTRSALRSVRARLGRFSSQRHHEVQSAPITAAVEEAVTVDSGEQQEVTQRTAKVGMLGDRDVPGGSEHAFDKRQGIILDNSDSQPPTVSETPTEDIVISGTLATKQSLAVEAGGLGRSTLQAHEAGSSARAKSYQEMVQQAMQEAKAAGVDIDLSEEKKSKIEKAKKIATSYAKKSYEGMRHSGVQDRAAKEAMLLQLTSGAAQTMPDQLRTELDHYVQTQRSQGEKKGIGDRAKGAVDTFKRAAALEIREHVRGQGQALSELRELYENGDTDAAVDKYGRHLVGLYQNYRSGELDTVATVARIIPEGSTGRTATEGLEIALDTTQTSELGRLLTKDIIDSAQRQTAPSEENSSAHTAQELRILQLSDKLQDSVIGKDILAKHPQLDAHTLATILQGNVDSMASGVVSTTEALAAAGQVTGEAVQAYLDGKSMKVRLSNATPEEIDGIKVNAVGELQGMVTKFNEALGDDDASYQDALDAALANSATAVAKTAAKDAARYAIKSTLRSTAKKGLVIGAATALGAGGIAAAPITVLASAVVGGTTGYVVGRRRGATSAKEEVGRAIAAEQRGTSLSTGERANTIASIDNKGKQAKATADYAEEKAKAAGKRGLIVGALAGAAAAGIIGEGEHLAIDHAKEFLDGGKSQPVEVGNTPHTQLDAYTVPTQQGNGNGGELPGASGTPGGESGSHILAAAGSRDNQGQPTAQVDAESATLLSETGKAPEPVKLGNLEIPGVKAGPDGSLVTVDGKPYMSDSEVKLVDQLLGETKFTDSSGKSITPELTQFKIDKATGAFDFSLKDSDGKGYLIKDGEMSFFAKNESNGKVEFNPTLSGDFGNIKPTIDFKNGGLVTEIQFESPAAENLTPHHIEMTRLLNEGLSNTFKEVKFEYKLANGTTQEIQTRIETTPTGEIQVLDEKGNILMDNPPKGETWIHTEGGKVDINYTGKPIAITFDAEGKPVIQITEAGKSGAQSLDLTQTLSELKTELPQRTPIKSATPVDNDLLTKLNFEPRSITNESGPQEQGLHTFFDQKTDTLRFEQDGKATDMAFRTTVDGKPVNIVLPATEHDGKSYVDIPLGDSTKTFTINGEQVPAQQLAAQLVDTGKLESYLHDLPKGTLKDGSGDIGLAEHPGGEAVLKVDVSAVDIKGKEMDVLSTVPGGKHSEVVATAEAETSGGKSAPAPTPETPAARQWEQFSAKPQEIKTESYDTSHQLDMSADVKVVDGHKVVEITQTGGDAKNIVFQTTINGKPEKIIAEMTAEKDGKSQFILDPASTKELTLATGQHISEGDLSKMILDEKSFDHLKVGETLDGSQEGELFHTGVISTADFDSKTGQLTYRASFTGEDKLASTAPWGKIVEPGTSKTPAAEPISHTGESESLKAIDAYSSKIGEVKFAEGPQTQGLHTLMVDHGSTLELQQQLDGKEIKDFAFQYTGKDGKPITLLLEAQTKTVKIDGQDVKIAYVDVPVKADSPVTELTLANGDKVPAQLASNLLIDKTELSHYLSKDVAKGVLDKQGDGDISTAMSPDGSKVFYGSVGAVQVEPGQNGEINLTYESSIAGSSKLPDTLAGLPNPDGGKADIVQAGTTVHIGNLDIKPTGEYGSKLTSSGALEIVGGPHDGAEYMSASEVNVAREVLGKTEFYDKDGHKITPDLTQFKIVKDGKQSYAEFSLGGGKDTTGQELFYAKDVKLSLFEANASDGALRFSPNIKGYYGEIKPNIDLKTGEVEITFDHSPAVDLPEHNVPVPISKMLENGLTNTLKDVKYETKDGKELQVHVETTATGEIQILDAQGDILMEKPTGGETWISAEGGDVKFNYTGKPIAINFDQHTGQPIIQVDEAGKSGAQSIDLSQKLAQFRQGVSRTPGTPGGEPGGTAHIGNIEIQGMSQQQFNQLVPQSQQAQVAETFGKLQFKDAQGNIIPYGVKYDATNKDFIFFDKSNGSALITATPDPTTKIPSFDWTGEHVEATSNAGQEGTTFIINPQAQGEIGNINLVTGEVSGEIESEALGALDPSASEIITINGQGQQTMFGFEEATLNHDGSLSDSLTGEKVQAADVQKYVDFLSAMQVKGSDGAAMVPGDYWFDYNGDGGFELVTDQGPQAEFNLSGNNMEFSGEGTPSADGSTFTIGSTEQVSTIPLPTNLKSALQMDLMPKEGSTPAEIGMSFSGGDHVGLTGVALAANGGMVDVNNASMYSAQALPHFIELLNSMPQDPQVKMSFHYNGDGTWSVENVGDTTSQKLLIPSGTSFTDPNGEPLHPVLNESTHKIHFEPGKLKGGTGTGNGSGNGSGTGGGSKTGGGGRPVTPEAKHGEVFTSNEKEFAAGGAVVGAAYGASLPVAGASRGGRIARRARNAALGATVGAMTGLVGAVGAEHAVSGLQPMAAVLAGTAAGTAGVFGAPLIGWTGRVRNLMRLNIVENGTMLGNERRGGNRATPEQQQDRAQELIERKGLRASPDDELTGLPARTLALGLYRGIFEKADVRRATMSPRAAQVENVSDTDMDALTLVWEGLVKDVNNNINETEAGINRWGGPVEVHLTRGAARKLGRLMHALKGTRADELADQIREYSADDLNAEDIRSNILTYLVTGGIHPLNGGTDGPLGGPVDDGDGPRDDGGDSDDGDTGDMPPGSEEPLYSGGLGPVPPWQEPPSGRWPGTGRTGRVPALRPSPRVTGGGDGNVFDQSGGRVGNPLGPDEENDLDVPDFLTREASGGSQVSGGDQSVVAVSPGEAPNLSGNLTPKLRFRPAADQPPAGGQGARPDTEEESGGNQGGYNLREDPDDPTGI